MVALTFLVLHKCVCGGLTFLLLHKCVCVMLIIIHSHAASSEQRMVPTGRHVNQLVAQARATKEGKESFSETNRVVVSEMHGSMMCFICTPQ